MPWSEIAERFERAGLHAGTASKTARRRARQLSENCRPSWRSARVRQAPVTDSGRLQIFSGSSHPILAKSIAQHAGVPLGALRATRFSNENIKIKIDENVRGCDVFVVQTAAP